MPIVYSDEVPTDLRTREWWYNSLDAAVTLEIHNKLSKHNANGLIYDFERAMQGPALDMMLRGFRIDPIWRGRSISELSKKEALIEARLNACAAAIWDKPLNPRSPLQLKEFFYDHLKLPAVWASKKGVRSISTDREALEKLSDYFIAAPFVSLILAARGTRKLLGVLRSGVGNDGRMRCTYNVCGTETGRWASSSSVWGDGTNLQNITDELRRMFVADPGYVLLYVDGEQAESRAVGFIQGELFGDWRYLDACEAGDLHTTVTQLVWPTLGWTTDAKRNRAIADAVFYRWFTYRDMAKRGGHGTSYYGQAWTMAKHLKVPQGLIETFQQKFAYGSDRAGTGAAFPAFPLWWKRTAAQLTTKQSITTFMGRERTFFGRPGDDSTLREAIAYEPQSAVGDIVNKGILQIWRKFPEAQVLAQIHDAGLFQIPETRLDLIPAICKAFQVPVRGRSGRELIIPAEAKVGWNWASYEMDKPVDKRTHKDGNPDGLRKYSPQRGDDRKRTEDPEASVLDRVVC